ncbi:tachykinins isoform X2 [Ceratina calcarata]|uniref:Tachykinins isoform X2 n=1 Tax=Ceratina calcarata TaxID=156304 RepID=A0AAJ7NFV2_9HYME|nr:tachykinins isoform X2 [Ceratina calcarata]
MNIFPIFLSLTLITFVLAEESEPSFADEHDDGFEEARGKKSFARLDPEELLKRAPMGFQGMRGKKNSIIADDKLFAEETNKRAPMGFQGMRGKKTNLITELEDIYSPDDYAKRAPMGFQGMRGKKLDDDYYKRAPMGFQGMRGKKSLEEILDEIKKGRFQDSKDKDVYLSDYPDYGRRAFPTDRYENILDKGDEYLREWEKRGPMGFQGTRGKKMILDTLEELDKRDVMAFHGMPDTEAGSDSFKRARMGFHGMRGKRGIAEFYEPGKRGTVDYPGDGSSLTENDLVGFEIEKRSPFRYLGVRGKKNPRWEFRGKFVGVRGKKSSTSLATGQRQPLF